MWVKPRNPCLTRGLHCNIYVVRMGLWFRRLKRILTLTYYKTIRFIWYCDLLRQGPQFELSPPWEIHDDGWWWRCSSGFTSLSTFLLIYLFPYLKWRFATCTGSILSMLTTKLFSMGFILPHCYHHPEHYQLPYNRFVRYFPGGLCHEVEIRLPES